MWKKEISTIEKMCCNRWYHWNCVCVWNWICNKVIRKAFAIDNCCGLQSNYRHWYDYMTYMWASDKAQDVDNGTRLYTITFPASCLHSLDPGSYYLLYFSTCKQSVIGYSDLLKVNNLDCIVCQTLLFSFFVFSVFFYFQTVCKVSK